MDDALRERPPAAKAGIATAIALTLLFLLSIPWSPLNLLPAIVFLAVAVGLYRGHAWSGFGGALFLGARWAGSLLAVGHFGNAEASWASLAVATVLIGGVAYLLFRAGRALRTEGRSPLVWGWIGLVTVTLVASMVFRAYVIPTGAMEDTLLIGDQIFANVLGASTPSRGDLVVFRYPVDTRQTFVKRCMGVPGDRIKLVNKQVYLNGKKLDEPYAYHKTEYIDSYRDNFPSEPNTHLTDPGRDMLAHHVVNGEAVVPPDSYFVMGDNRDSSLDRRYWGFVPRADLAGKPSFIYWSYQAPTDPAGSQIVDRYQHFFSKTRWSRVCMPLHSYPIH